MLELGLEFTSLVKLPDELHPFLTPAPIHPHTTNNQKQNYPYRSLPVTIAGIQCASPVKIHFVPRVTGRVYIEYCLLPVLAAVQCSFLVKKHLGIGATRCVCIDYCLLPVLTGVQFSSLVKIHFGAGVTRCVCIDYCLLPVLTGYIGLSNWLRLLRLPN